MRHVITLSTIPPRFGSIGPALTALVAQTSRPEAIEVYIPKAYRRFPQWGGGLPSVPDGVRIVRTDEDLGPATKILPAARAYRGQNVELLYVDDDRIFAKDWAKTSLALRRDHPGVAICGVGFRIRLRYGYQFPDGPPPSAVTVLNPRSQPGFQLRQFLRWLLPGHRDGQVLRPYVRRIARSGFTDIAEGYGGVLVRPDFFDDHALRIPQLAWAVDDIWLSGMLTRRGIPIWADRALYKVHEIMGVSSHFPLYRAVIDGADRAQANRATIEYMRATYGIWGGKVVNED